MDLYDDHSQHSEVRQMKQLMLYLIIDFCLCRNIETKKWGYVEGCFILYNFMLLYEHLWITVKSNSLDIDISMHRGLLGTLSDI